MLGHPSAVAMLKDCGARIQRFAQTGYVPVAEDFEAVAGQLSLLGFFIDALGHGETDFDAFAARLRSAEGPVAKAATEEAQPAATFEAEALFEPEVAAPAPTFVVPPAVAPAVESAESAHEEIDAELLEIFLEEAEEVLASIEERLAELAADPRNVEALTTIRRSAHTLKGSGYMVGLAAMGDVAWAFEQALNMWLRQDMAVTPALLAFIGDARQLFARWVAALENHSADIPDPSDFVARADAMRGEPAPAPVAAAGTAVHSVELPVAQAGEAPSVSVDLAAGSVPFGVPAAADATGGDMFSGLPLAGLGQPEGPASEMADMFAGLAAPAAAFAPPLEPVAPAPTLYDIFREEARGHLERLVTGYAELDNNPAPPTSFEMTRAAHTLAGIAATVGLMPLHHLARALEHALLRRDACGHPDSIGGLETARQAIITLEQMFAGLARQEAPEEQMQLIVALEDVFAVAEPAADDAAVLSGAPAEEPPGPAADGAGSWRCRGGTGGTGHHPEG